MARLGLAAVLIACLLTAGCVSLAPSEVPDSSLDASTGNGWRYDPANSSDVSGGLFSKRAVNAYIDRAEDDQGHPGRLTVLSLRGLLSPDREELRDRVNESLRENAQRNGLELSSKTHEGQRDLANGARSFFITFNATAESEDSVFASDADVRILGEVFRCTGGATVVVTGSAQVSESESVGGVQTSGETDPKTWAEIVRDPQGTIGGFRGQGLVYTLACRG